MQWGEVRVCGTGCTRTHSGEHHYEDQENGTWWCRQCGIDIKEGDMPLTKQEETALRAEVKKFKDKCADMIEELLSDDPEMPTHADTIRRAEALLAELRQ